MIVTLVTYNSINLWQISEEKNTLIQQVNVKTDFFLCKDICGYPNSEAIRSNSKEKSVKPDG